MEGTNRNMGTDIIEIPELAIDQAGRQFALHPETAYFIVEKLTQGRSYVVRVQGKVLLIEARASYKVFQEEVGYRPGLYRLKQADKDGVELDAPTGFAEIEGENFGRGTQDYDLQGALALCHRMAQANEHKDTILADVTQTLMHTHVQLQAGSARMLEAANTTIRIANGIEAIERGQTIIDVDRITEAVIEAMDDREPPAKPGSPWYVQLLAGPLGVRLLQILENALPTQPKP